MADKRNDVPRIQLFSKEGNKKNKKKNENDAPRVQLFSKEESKKRNENGAPRIRILSKEESNGKPAVAEKRGPSMTAVGILRKLEGKTFKHEGRTLQIRRSGGKYHLVEIAPDQPQVRTARKLG